MKVNRYYCKKHRRCTLKEDRIVYLLVGPRGAGKSTYASAIVKERPDFFLMSRDAIIVELYGSEHTDPYSGAGYHAMNTLYARLNQKLSGETKKAIVLDCWTRDSQERQTLIARLREYGAGKVIALLLTTPLAFVEQWFWKKPGIAKMQDIGKLQGKGFVFYMEDAPERDFALFHELAKNIDEDGFDQIIRVDPLQAPIVLP